MVDAEATIRRRIVESAEAKRALLDGGVVRQMADLAGTIAAALRNGNKVLFFGNGGSAADATHLAAEFVGRYVIDREPLNAISLTDNGSSLSAIANDYTYDEVFARQVRALGRAGDVAIGLSTSGQSRNVIAGLRAAGRAGLHTAAFTGANGGELPAVAKHCLRMPAQETARIQECYMLVGHTVCELVEAQLFGFRRRRRPPRLVLLDRDGTLNRKPAEGAYITEVRQLALLPGVAAAVRRLNDAAVPLAVVTNQRGVALGRLTAAELDLIHAALVTRLDDFGARVDAIYHCPHDRGACRCRKPEPGLLERASADFGVPLEDAAMVGDTDSDVEAGRRAGTFTIQLVTPGRTSTADLTAPDLPGAVELLLSR